MSKLSVREFFWPFKAGNLSNEKFFVFISLSLPEQKFVLCHFFGADEATFLSSA